MSSVDSFIRKGCTHPICQDYSWSQPGLVIVSDGCSSSPNTDIGSRLVTHSFLKMYKYEGKVTHYATDQLEAIAVSAAKTLSLDTSCLDATLVVAEEKEDFLNVYMRGDGVVSYLYPDVLVVKVYSYPKNAPFYFTYDWDKSRGEVYNSLTGNERQVKTYIINFTTSEILSSDNSSDEPFHIPIDSIHLESSGLQGVIISSDGFMSLQDSLNEFDTLSGSTEGIWNFARELFKSTQFEGYFFKRRIQSFLDKVTTKRDRNQLKPVHFSDDLGMATIRF